MKQLLEGRMAPLTFSWGFLGIRLFDPGYYGPTGLLIETGDPSMAKGLSLREAQERLGIV